jgi:hypothetical protein
VRGSNCATSRPASRTSAARWSSADTGSVPRCAGRKILDELNLRGASDGTEVFSKTYEAVRGWLDFTTRSRDVATGSGAGRETLEATHALAELPGIRGRAPYWSLQMSSIEKGHASILALFEREVVDALRTGRGLSAEDLDRDLRRVQDEFLPLPVEVKAVVEVGYEALEDYGL